MRLHELYFGNLVKDGKGLDSEVQIATLINDQFGSFEDWQKAFKAVGSMPGIGWVVLTYDPEAKQLFNVWINEHDVGHLAGAVPLLVMDVFEHAFMVDYGLNKAEYIQAFFEAIDWSVVAHRLG